MSDPIDDYLRSLRRELGSIPDADDVVAEIEDHLLEACSSPTGADADRARAAEAAIGRLGEPALVARSVRMESGRLRGNDPVPIRRWVFTIAEVMLILAAAAYGVAAWLHHQPCSADFDDLGTITQACLDRGEAAEVLPFPALPFGFDGLTPGPATQWLFLVAVLLMAGSLAVFVPLQPWFASTKATGLALAALSLTTGAAAIVHLADPETGLPWWGLIAAVGVELACVCAATQVWADPPDLGRLARPSVRPVQSISFSRYRTRASLVLIAAGGAGGLHLPQLPLLGPLAALTGGVGHWLDPEWSLPGWVAYQASTAAIVAPAVLSLLLGRRGRRRGLDAGTHPITGASLVRVAGEAG